MITSGFFESDYVQIPPSVLDSQFHNQDRMHKPNDIPLESVELTTRKHKVGRNRSTAVIPTSALTSELKDIPLEYGEMGKEIEDMEDPSSSETGT